METAGEAAGETAGDDASSRFVAAGSRLEVARSSDASSSATAEVSGGGLGYGGFSLGPPLTRTPSLGQQAAMALPHDLQEIALQLIDNTDLQDQCLREVRDNAPNARRLASAGSALDANNPEDLESFLWDFLEANQDKVHGAAALDGELAEGLV